MAPLTKKTIQHFTHFHPLTKVSANTEFLCDGCSTLGFGTRYRCEPCDFDLHDHCANSPLEISSFMHQHVSTTYVATLLKVFSIVPCEEEIAMSVPRSLKTPAPPPLASLPSFDAYYDYGFGVIPPLPYSVYAYGVSYAHGREAPSSYGEFYEVNSYQTHSNGSQV
ncbi:C1-like protein [Gossypium australe]|uniref:C1-like protein n=1 Tax=Gossypium australe TaxID=47621 RepID=A0A5B6V3P1_9ROSI|nr:C1-like protein [Gossypium australe]